MIQLIILLGIISIIDFSTKKIPVVVLVVMGIAGMATVIPYRKGQGIQWMPQSSLQGIQQFLLSVCKGSAYP